ncbi:chromosome segregation protein SMC [Clostridium sp.]|uniref:chromosome segregation protein SMC n=1 Tax=Clostridium sp. TaxID=1506 RepID=UPI002913EB7A|nr:chromosome segregation protein SMC [Clostridium sp.]MDU4846156.1 chromosome segregation protein SMC [Clostridium sp.]
MIKIDEKRDLSKRVLDIDINSPIFAGMLDDLNKEIQRVIQNVYEGKFASGEISLKLDLKIVSGFEEMPKVDEYGEMITETYKYKKPDFEHKITSTLKQQYKQEGSYSEKKEVVWDEKDKKFIVKPIRKPQLEFANLENREDEQ